MMICTVVILVPKTVGINYLWANSSRAKYTHHNFGAEMKNVSTSRFLLPAKILNTVLAAFRCE